MSIGRVLLGVAAVALISGVALLVVQGQRLPEGPEPVAWDREACAHCRMHVGQPGFAVQLQLEDGAVLDFDDPGCFFSHEESKAQEAPVHAVWFHDLHEDRWLRPDEVAFVLVNESPMGFGLGAVEAGTPGAMGMDAAKQHALAVRAAGGAP